VALSDCQALRFQGGEFEQMGQKFVPLIDGHKPKRFNEFVCVFRRLRWRWRVLRTREQGHALPLLKDNVTSIVV